MARGSLRYCRVCVSAAGLDLEELPTKSAQKVKNMRVAEHFEEDEVGLKRKLDVAKNAKKLESPLLSTLPRLAALV